MKPILMKIILLSGCLFAFINLMANDTDRPSIRRDSAVAASGKEFDEVFILEEAKRIGLNPLEAMYYVQNIKASYMGQKYQQELLEQTVAAPQGIQQSMSGGATCYGLEDYLTGSSAFYGSSSPWQGSTFLVIAPNSVLNPKPGLVRGRHTIVSDREMRDPFGKFPIVAPRWSTEPGGSNYVSMKLGNRMVGGEGESAKVTITVHPATDGDNTLLAYSYALVLQDPSAITGAPPHDPADKPFFEVKVRIIGPSGPHDYSDCAGFKVIAGSDLAGYYYSEGGAYVYKPWTQNIFDYKQLPGFNSGSYNYPNASSMDIELEFTTADCTLGGHFGYAYVDVSCTSPKIKRTGSSCKDGFSAFSTTMLGNFRQEDVTWRFYTPYDLLNPIASVSGSINIDAAGEKTVFSGVPIISSGYNGLVEFSESSTIEKPKLAVKFVTDVIVEISVTQKDAGGTAICTDPVRQFLTYSVTDCEGKIVKCKECITSFAPIPGNKYVLSAWVREENTQPITYTEPGITINLSGPGTSYNFQPKGKIIDGWQKIEEEFWVPEGTHAIDIVLKNLRTSSPQYVYFDDIRVFPFKANMKSYVYDPYTQKLVAELDENNYATYYEYDEEGGLRRVKKETERGVMTIKESGSNQSK